MPAVIPAVAAAFAYEGAIAYGYSALVASVAAAAAAAAAQRIISPKPGRQQQLPTFQAEAKDRQVVVRSSVEPRRVVYGTAVVSGPLAYAETTGANNKFLHLVVPLTGHEVTAIDAVFADDEELPIAADGSVQGRWRQSLTAESTHSELMPGPGQTVTVPATVVAVHSVYVDYGGNLYSFYELVESDPDNWFGYSRSGSVFTFSASQASGFAGGTITILYTSVTDNSFMRVKKHLGTDAQTADSDLVAESGGQWTANHRLRGIAYIYVRLEYDERVFPTGIPNFKAVVRGKKVKDPRLGSPTVTQWSENWALIVRDYLTSSQGLGCDDEEIDDTLIIAAANEADELVQLQAGSPSASHKRYTANGTVNLSDRPVDILSQLLSAAAGSAVFAEGAWKIYAGAYATPTVEIDEDWLRGPVKVRAKPPRRELFNAVRGTYSEPEKFWQPTDFPPVTNSTYETQDGGQQIPRDIELPFTTSSVRAQRIAKIHLEKSRQGIVVELPCNLKAFRIAVLDTVQLTLERFGWTQKVFQVIGWKFSPEGGVDLILQEEASSVYDWAAGEETSQDPAPDTDLVSPFEPEPPTALTVSYTQDSNRVLVSWTASADGFVNAYQVEYKKTSEASYTIVPRVNGTGVDLGNLLPDDYDIRVKAINVSGVPSAYLSTTHTIAKGSKADTYPILMSIVADTWTEQSNPKNTSLQDVIWDGSQFVAVGSNDGADAYILTSPDGITWTERANPKAFSLFGVCLGELPGSPTVNRLVAVGNADGTDAYIVTSDNGGVTWTERTNPKNAILLDVAWNGSLFVAVGHPPAGSPTEDAYIITSSDGITWTERENPASQVLSGVAWSDDLSLFAAVGWPTLVGSPTEQSYILTSPDGITWTRRTSPTVLILAAVIWSADDQLFIATGDDILTSSDGITWTVQTHPKTGQDNILRGAAEWNGSINVAVGNGDGTDAYIVTSSDGETWIERPNPKNISLASLAWSGRFFVAVGGPDGADAYIIRSLPIS